MTHSSRKARFDQTLVVGTWLVVAGAALPFGCAGRSESSSGTPSGQPDGFTPHADNSHLPSDGKLTSGGAAGGLALGGSSAVDGGLTHYDGHSDGTQGGRGAVDGRGPVDGRAAAGGGGRPVTDGGFHQDGADGTLWSDGDRGDGDWSDGDRGDGEPCCSDGTSDPGWSDGAPDDGSPG
jgi:hypothetical protein